MNKHSFFIVYTIGCLLAYCPNYSGDNKVVFSGSIQFPHSLKKVPAVRVYWAGHTIACETNKNSKTINFNIPGLRQQRGIYLVIAQDVRFKMVKNNVIVYLYLDKKTPYKFYGLELVPHFDEGTKKTKLLWQAAELALLCDDVGNFRLPDEAIVVYYPPKFIAGLEGGSALQLPTIKVDPTIVSTLGEPSLQDASDTVLCAALSMDAIHRELDKDIRPADDHKTIITITT
ncbi:hypothetical protein JST99_00565 [Candidatus Dependentiae bacterium]|nr:hypothetical protein [Candidatus Dependentiae bacterium]